MTLRMLAVSLALAVTATAATAQWGGDRGPGIAPERRGEAMVYRVDGFDEVALGGNATVEVRVGPGFSVVARGPAAAFANFRVERRGHTLELGRRYQRGGDQSDRAITVLVTLPRIAGASLGGAGRLAVDRVAGERFHGAVGGSGRMALGDVAVNSADLSIGGSGSIEAAGRAEALSVSIGGSGDLAAPRLRAHRAEVSVGGSGSVRATVDGPATVSVAGSGDVDLGPGARCRTSKVGSGKVRCGG